jgi:hypothetical protein
MDPENMNSKLDRNGITIKICSDCEKNSNEIDFHMSKDNKPIYYSKRCINCQNKYRIKLKTRDVNDINCIMCKLNSSEVDFDYYKFPDKKIYHSRCKICTEKIQSSLKTKYIPERFCLRCEESSDNKEFRTKFYSATGKNYNVNYCIECEKFMEYEKILKKYNFKEKKCKYCEFSSLETIFKYYVLKDKTILCDYCIECTYKATEPAPKLCGKCGKSSFEVVFKLRKSFKKTGYEMVYDNICKDCATIDQKEYESTIKKYNARLKSCMYNAKERNHNWDLMNEEAIAFFKQNCYYCGKESSTNKDMNGIDRVDNKQGYSLENCVTCCGMCNYMKGTFIKEEFIQKCIKIAELHSNSLDN